MDFAAMKRRELQALCKRHGLVAGGTNADLVARLTATLSGSAGAAEEAVGVVVGKGCLKRSAPGASGGDLDAAKKVTFEGDTEAEVGVTGRGSRRSQVLSSPAVAKTRGRVKTGEAPPAAKGNGDERRRTRSQAGGHSADESGSGEAGADGKATGRGKAGEAPPASKGKGAVRRRTRSQAGGDSADESDSVEAGADALGRRSGRNTVSLGAGDGAERVAGAVSRKNSAKVEQEEVDVADVACRKHQLKRKSRENDIEDVDVSRQVGVSRRSTRSSSLLLEPDALSSPVEKKRGRKAADVKEKTCVEELPTEALYSGRTLRSGVVVATVPPIVSESNKSKREVQEVEPAVEKKVAEVEISRRTTRSSAVAGPLTAPTVIVKKRGRKTDDVHLDGGLDKKMENKRQSSRPTTRGSIHHLASNEEEASLEQVAAPSKGLPLRRSRRNPSEANLMLNSNTTSESSIAPTVGNGLKIAPPTMLNAAKDGVEDVVEKPDQHAGLKRSKLRNVSATVATNGGEIPFSDSSGKASAIDMQIEAPGPVRRSTRKSVVPSSLEHETNDMHENVEKKQTVTKPVGRSTCRSVAPDIVEKESKVLTKGMVPEAHVKRQTRKSVVPDMLEKGRKSVIKEIIPDARVKRSTRKPALPIVNSENNDHCEVASTENLQSDKSDELQKQPAIKQPVRRVTRKSAVPAMLEKDRKGVPDMLNNKNNDRTEMQSDQVVHLEKQLLVKEHVRRSTVKSVIPDMTEKESKGLHEELKPEVSARTPVCKSVVPNVVNKENKDHNEFDRREELSVKTRGAHTSLQIALQNDESLRRTTRQSSKLVLSPPQTKPTASKGRPAKRRRRASLQESMPAEEQKEDHTSDVIEVVTSSGLEIGVPPFTVEKTDLQDSQLNSERQGMVVVEPGLGHDKDNSGILEVELEGTVCTTEKRPSNLPILDCQRVGALSEEAGHSIENEAGRCSPNFEQSPTGLQFLYSQGISERSSTHNAIPCPENCVEVSDVHKDEVRVETVVSSKSDSDQGSGENSLRVEESGGCAFSSQQNNEQDGFSVSIYPKDLVASAQLDPSEDLDHVVRDAITKDLIRKEEEKDFIPSSDINVPHEVSTAHEPAENASGVGGDVFCISRSTPISDEVNSDSSRLESPDALDNCLASSNTETVQQDNKEECHLHNGVTHGIHVSGISEAAQVEVLKSGKMLLPDKETSASQDAQLNRKHEGDEFEEHSFSCVEDRSGKNNMSQLANEYVMDSCQEQELKLPHDPSADKSPKGYTTCQDEFVIGSGIGGTSVSIVKGNKVAMDAPGTPFCPQPFFSEESIGEPSENAAPAVHDRNGVDESKDIHVEYGVEKPPVPESVSDLDSSSDFSAVSKSEDCGYTSDQCNENEGLTKSCHEQDQMASQLDLLEAANCMKEQVFNNPEDVSDDEESKKPVHSADISFSCEKIDAPGLVKHASGIGDGLLSSSMLASTDDTDVHPSSNPNQFESTDFLDELKGCSSTEALHQGFEEQCDAPKEDHVTYGACLRDKVEADTAKDLENDVPPLPVEDRSNILEYLFLRESSKGSDMHRDLVLPNAENEDDSNTYCAELQVEKMVCSEADSSKGSDLNGDIVLPSSENEDDYVACDVEPKIEKMVSSEPDSHQGSHEDLTIVETIREYMFSSQLEHEKDEQIIAPLLAAETSALPDEQARAELQVEKMVCSEPDSSKGSDMHGDIVLPSAENEYDSVACHVELEDEKMVSLEPDSHPGSHEDLTIVEGIRDCMISSQLEHEKIEQVIAPLLGAETSALPDEQAHAGLQVEKMVCSEPDSSKGSDMHGDILLPSAENEDDSVACHVEPEVEKMVSSESVSHPGSHEDLTIVEGIRDCMISSQLEHEKNEQVIAPLLGAETSALPDQQPNPEVEAAEFEKCNLSGEDTVGQDAETLTSPDEPPNPELDEQPNPELDEQPNPELEVGEDSCGKIVTGYVKNNLLQLNEESRMDPIQEKELPTKSPEQSTIGQDAETAPSLDEQPNPELEVVESEEHNLSSEDTTDLPAPKSPVQSTIGQDAETFPSPNEQPYPELEAGDSEEHNLISEDTTDLPASKSPEQSTIGQDAETSPWPDEQPNPELDVGEFVEGNLIIEDTSGIFGTGYVNTKILQLHDDSHMNHIQGKELPIGQGAETSVLLDEQPNPELEGCDFEECNFSCEDTTGIFDTGYDNLFQLDDYSPMDPSQGEELPNYQHAPRSPKQSTIGQDENVTGSETSPVPDEKFDPELEGGEFKEHKHSCDEAASYIFSSGSVKNNTCHWDDKEEYNELNDQATATMLSSGLTKPTLVEGSESGTAALPDEQLISKLEDDKEQNLCFDTDSSNISATGLMENSRLLFSLPGDAHTETGYEHELPIGTPAAKSVGESAVCPDGSVPGSVGICQTSGRRRIDEEFSTKLLSFKISSAVKRSYIAMDSAITGQGDNVNPISLTESREEAPAASADHPAELNTTNLSVAEDSSRQGTTDGL
uniref:Uncharacterized protein n=1 Tax=Avena sativa TaxID=4498 RepID=A0ACD5Y813_AVESA